jgi:hypothetical protein
MNEHEAIETIRALYRDELLMDNIEEKYFIE